MIVPLLKSVHKQKEEKKKKKASIFSNLFFAIHLSLWKFEARMQTPNKIRGPPSNRTNDPKHTKPKLHRVVQNEELEVLEWSSLIPDLCLGNAIKWASRCAKLIEMHLKRLVAKGDSTKY